ncbi:MAG: DUF2341 domain-containing protein, partial [Bacteroidales bacterium]|nr:DUF2341 domain-containing protein [Bacteroidales bacterium]
MIGNRNIGIVNASAVGDLIIRNLNNKLKVILFILILAAGGSISSFGQLCPAVPFGYQYQKTFEINGSLVGGVLINFPVLVNITNPISNELKNVIYGGHVCDINGNDIIFTDANYNRLEHQIESYNNTTGRLIAWVRFPILGNSGNTTFRVLYGNCQITSSQSSGIVWSPDYRGVWHLSGSDYTDASPAGNDGTPNIVSTASGKIAGGASFNGNSSYLRMPSLNGVVATNQPHTISIWAKYNPVPNTVQNFISFQNSGDMSSVQVGFRGSRPNAWKWEGATLASAPTAPSTKDWHYYVYTFDGTTHRLYVDGVPHQSTASAQTGIPNEANLGRYNNGEYFDGELDEARYSVTARSAEWITTEFNNQNDQVMGSGRFIQSIGPETEYNSPSYYIFDLCEGTTVNYRIPSQAGHTYTWTITGGTPATYVGNPVTVTWGAPGTGTIMLNDHSGLCDGNSPVYSVIIRPRPTAPTLNTKTPNLPEVCAGQSVSATFNPGTGGVGCTDAFQYRYDGSGIWATYTPGTGLSTTGHTLVEIQGRRAGCTGGPGCTESDWVSLASWIVNPQPLAPTLAVKTPNLMVICAGQTVSATFNPGSGGTGCTDAFQYRFDGGSWATYFPGQVLGTNGHISVTIRGMRGGCTSLSGCSGTTWYDLATWTVNPQPLAPTINTRIPDLAAVCEGTLVSATFNSGTGGSGCSDSFQYRFDGTGTWYEYTPGNTINTTGHTLAEIQGRRSDCTAGSGCTGTGWADLASWNVNPQPAGPALDSKSPDLAAVCAGQAVSATFTSGSGGVGCSDLFQYSYDGSGTWINYTPGNAISTSGHNRVQIRGQRSGCTAGSGCTETAWVTLAEWNVNLQPTGPALDVRLPALAAVCAGQAVSATFVAGSGGVGCSDAFEYSYDNSGIWSDYISGSDIGTTGHTRVEIRGQRTGCTAGSGCTGTGWATLASWDVNPQPTGPALNVKSPDLAAVCGGETVSATFTSGSGGAGCSDVFQYSYDGSGTWNGYIPGNGISTAGHNRVQIRGQRAGCTTGSGCTGTSWATLADWNVNLQPVAPTLAGKLPNLAAVCAGQAVSATFMTGSGGVGCSDAFGYSYDNSGIWNNYLSGSEISTTGHSKVEIRGQRTGCTAGSGCTGTSWVTLAEWNVYPQPTSPALNVKTPDLAATCAGQPVSATFVAGSGGAGCTDSFRYSYDGSGTWTAYTPGSTIITTGHTLIEIQGRRAGCTTGSGCTGTDWTTLVSWDINLQPAGPALDVRSPALVTVCAGQPVSATFLAGSGGVGCSDVIEFSYDNSGNWSSYIPGSDISTTGHSRVEIRGQRTGCTADAGCTGTEWVILAAWDINLQPTGPTLDAKTPDLATICDGQPVSAAFTAGTGGVGCSDAFEYSYNNSGIWNNYIPGSDISTTGHSRVEIRGQRTGCTSGAGCTGTDWVILATWDINLQPTGPVLDVKTPDLATICDGQPVSATFTAGTGGVGCSDVFGYSYDNSGIWSDYTPGSNISTTGHSKVEIRGHRTGCTTGAGCTGTDWATLASWDVNPQPTSPALNIKSPALDAVCDGETVSATFSPGTGGVGCTDSFRYSYDGTSTWVDYTPGSTIITTGHTLIEIQGRRAGCTAGAGCTGTDWAILVSWNINPQPTGPTLDVKTPDLATICDGQPVSATFTAGTGGVGCSDAFGYSYDNSGFWNDYIPGSDISTTGHTRVEIRGQRTGCTAGAGCTGTDWIILATWDINPQPTGPTLDAKTPDLAAVCDGETVSATFTPGTGGVGCTDSFRYSYDGTGTWIDYTPGTAIITTGHSLVEIQGRSSGCTAGSGCGETPWETLVSWVVNPYPVLSSTLTPDPVCSGSVFSYTPESSVPLTGFAWTRTAVAGILPGTDGSGNGNPNEVLENTTSVPINVRYQYTLSANGCSNSTIYNVDVVVNPIPVMSSTLTPDPICSGTVFNYTPQSLTADTNFDWTRAEVAGISTSGSGSGTDNPNEILTNNTNSPVTVSYVYTLTANGCTNPSDFIVNITVNPTADVAQPDDQVVCNEGATADIEFTTGNTGGTVTYTWTNDTPSIGLAGTGNGDIPTFTATNTTLVPVVATIIVTPHFENGGTTCDGPAKTFTITVNPTADVAQPDDHVVCNEGATADIEFTTGNTGGTVTYTWTNDTPSIGLAGTGNGDILSFTTTNTTLVPVVATIVVTPHFENTGTTCDGPTKTFTITVNPTADVAKPDDQVVCNEGATADIEFTTGNTGGTVTYTWTNDTPSIGLAGT